ncbi:MAG: M4 family metallopeptidase [Anaerolineales bacterium]
MEVAKNRWVIIGLLAVAFIAVYWLYQRLPSPTVSTPQQAAYERLKEESAWLPELSFQNGFPRGVIADVRVEGGTAVERAQNFLAEYQDLYLQTNPELTLNVRRVIESDGFSSVVFYQSYRGVPVHGGEIVVLVDEDGVFTTVGGLLTSDLILETQPALSDRQALEIARQAVNDPTAMRRGSARLMIFDPSLNADVQPEPHLAWRVNLLSDGLQWVFVDARNGNVLNIAPALSYSAGLDDFLLDLEDAEHEANSVDDNCFDESDDSDAGDEDGLESDYENDPVAVQVLEFSKNTYLFFHETFGMHSYDNDDGELEVFIHSTLALAPAAWPRECDLMELRDDGVAFDAFVHEYSHGIVSKSSNFQTSGQSGMLDEGFANVMAAIAEGGDWRFGQDLFGNDALHLCDPSQDNIAGFDLPEHMDDFVTMSADLHINSSIISLVACLLETGQDQNGVLIDPIGLGHTANLFFLAMRSLASSAQFVDARNIIVGIASQNIGPQSHEVCQVRNAFFAVGLGEGDKDCDGVADNADLDDNQNGTEDWQETNFANPYILCPTPFVPCDTNDWDGDGQINFYDNCPFDYNPLQEDANNNFVGDVCDQDSDLDGFSDNQDNCPFTANADQENTDGDYAGDACEVCDDAYNVIAWHTGWGFGDPYPLEPDIDGDGTPDACDDGSFLDEAYWGDFYAEVPSDGKSHEAKVIGEAEQWTLLPVPACTPGQADPFSATFRGLVTLSGLPRGVRARMISDDGSMAGKGQGEEGLTQLLFKPEGGREYALALSFDESTAGKEISFQFSFECGEKEALLADSGGEAETPVPADMQLTVIPVQNANCRLGPSSTAFENVDILFMGAEYTPMAQGPDQMWLLFDGPDYDGNCWVFVESLDLFCGAAAVEIGDTSPCLLLVERYPPFPTLTPTPTFTPEPGEPTSTPAAPLPECSDGIDNDGDGDIDMADGRCVDPSDNDESG